MLPFRAARRGNGYRLAAGLVAAIDQYRRRCAGRSSRRPAGHPGLVETQFISQVLILDRCRSEDGTLAEAIAEVAGAKRASPRGTVCAGAPHARKGDRPGTMHMRTHVEVDPRVELRSRRYPPPQGDTHGRSISRSGLSAGGLTNDSGTRLVDRGLRAGADVIGGCPIPTRIRPSDRAGFCDRRRFDLDIVSISTSIRSVLEHLDEVCRQTNGTAGAGASPSATSPSCRYRSSDLCCYGRRLADAGISSPCCPPPTCS